MNKNQRRPPLPDKLLKCWGSDWSDFTCFGKMVRYKNGKGQRFFIQNKNGNFEVDRDTWKSIERWEYVE